LSGINEKTKAHAAVIAANLIFGANFSVVKYISPRLTGPFALNLMRVAVTVILFWFLYLLKPSSATIQRKHLVRFLLCGVTGVAINQLLFIKGLTMTSPIHASLLILATPIFITILAIFFAKEKPSFFKFAGLVLGIAGAVLLVLQKEHAGIGSNILLGDIFCTINAVSYALYFILVRPLMKEYTPVHVIRWVFTFGAVMVLPFGINEFTKIDWSLFHLPDYASLAFVVVGATFFAYLFNIYGLSHLNASVVGTYIYTQPVYAAIIAMLFWGEILTWQKIVAAFLIFGGVFLANRVVKD
jgi:drug/metabolite transporter (DMT)-like permease